MTLARYSLLLVVLALPLSVGCGGQTGGTPEPGDIEAFFEANPSEPTTEQIDVEPPPT